MNINLNLEINTNEKIDKINRQMGHEDVLNFVTALDELAEDMGFTEQLIRNLINNSSLDMQEVLNGKDYEEYLEPYALQ